MNIDWKNICDGRTAIHTPKLDDAIYMYEMLKTSYPDATPKDSGWLRAFWEQYKDQCCYRFTFGYKEDNTSGSPDYIRYSYCRKEWYEAKAPKYRVVEFGSIFNPDFGQIESGYLSAADAFAALF